MTDFPCDIRREIFLLLPAKSLIRFRAVCKSWRETIDDPSFVKAHTHKQLSSNTVSIRNSTGPPFYPLYSIDLETLDFANGLQTIRATPLTFSRGGLSRLSGSMRGGALPACDGLMLAGPPVEDVNENWEIWNPLTHERLELPQRDFNSDAVARGIGYDYATDDYKVVFIDSRCVRDNEEYVYETHTYSLKLDSWRKIRDCPCDDWRGPSGAGVFLSGALHWMSWDMIIALDLGAEKYSKMKLPPLHLRDRDKMLFRNKSLYVLGGCLMVSDFGKDDWLFYHFDVWVMKDYGVEDSWVKLFCIEDDYILERGSSLRPVAYMKNRMQMLLQDDNGFYLVDVESNSIKIVSIHGLSGSLSAQIFHGSILRLHDNCGVSGNATKRRRMRKRKGSEMKKKMTDAKLTFCLRDVDLLYHSHDSCHSKDSNWWYSSSEEED